MRTIYLDCGMGAAGDMLTAALLELHDDPETAVEALNRAFAGKAVLSVQKDRKCGIAGSRVTVSIDGEVEGEVRESAEHRHHHATLRNVRAFIGSLELPAEVIENALAVYDLITEAEA